jgi:hypothetical protein
VVVDLPGGVVGAVVEQAQEKHLRSLMLTRALPVTGCTRPPRAATGPRHAAGNVTGGIWEPLVDWPNFKRRAADFVRPGAAHLTSRARHALAVDDRYLRHVRTSSRGTLRKDPSGQCACQAAGHIQSRSPTWTRSRGGDGEGSGQARRYRKILAAETDDAAVVKARHEVADIEAELNDRADLVGSVSLSATLAARAEPGILGRLEAAQKRQQDLQRRHGCVADQTVPGVREPWSWRR